ncbi:MAG: ABC transporter permease, partial [Clostridium sp.]
MKSYKGLIGRYIKNEKRSVVPIFISIILTITLITSVVFITQNIMKNEFEEKKIVFGDYDVRLQKINNERLNKLKGHENVKDFALGKVDSLSKLLKWEYNGEEQQYDMFYDVYAVEKKFFDEYINFKVVEGRLPENEGEIVVDQKALGLTEEGSRVGSSIEFIKNKRGEDGGEKVNYTIVGIIETDIDDRLFGGKLIRLITKDEMVNPSEEFEAFTYLKDPSKKEDIANDLGLKYIIPTLSMTDPFGYPAAEIKYPGYNKEAYSALIGNRLARTILAIIIFFCLTAVYNTFHTSVAKRIKVYGVLRAIGGNMNQISYLIYGEALILYLVAAPIGLILGYGLTKLESYVLINVFGLLDKFTIDFNLEVILIVLISVFFIIAVAVKSVLRKEGKLTPIEAIMDARGLTRKRKSLGKNLVGQSLSESGNGVEDEEAIKELLAYDKTTFKFKIMQKLFKFEGELAHKNITRDVSANRLTKSTLFLAMAILIFFFLQIVNGTIGANNIVKSDKWDTEMSLKENKFKNNVIDDIKNVNG